MIRTKGEAGTGNIVEGVRHMRALISEIKRLGVSDAAQLMTEAKNMGAPYELLVKCAQSGKLPVPKFFCGGISTPADAALCRQLGAEAIFVGSGIFKSQNPEKFAKAIVKACTQYNNPSVLLEVSKDLGSAMKGLEMKEIAPENKLAERGW